MITVCHEKKKKTVVANRRVFVTCKFDFLAAPPSETFKPEYWKMEKSFGPYEMRTEGMYNVIFHTLTLYV